MATLKEKIVEALHKAHHDIEYGDEMAELQARMSNIESAAERIGEGEDITEVLEDEMIDIEDLDIEDDD